jgi:hypothetical protein
MAFAIGDIGSIADVVDEGVHERNFKYVQAQCGHEGCYQ